MATPAKTTACNLQHASEDQNLSVSEQGCKTAEVHTSKIKRTHCANLWSWLSNTEWLYNSKPGAIRDSSKDFNSQSKQVYSSHWAVLSYLNSSSLVQCVVCVTLCLIADWMHMDSWSSQLSDRQCEAPKTFSSRDCSQFTVSLPVNYWSHIVFLQHIMLMMVWMVWSDPVPTDYQKCCGDCFCDNQQIWLISCSLLLCCKSLTLSVCVYHVNICVYRLDRACSVLLLCTGCCRHQFHNPGSCWEYILDSAGHQL